MQLQLYELLLRVHGAWLALMLGDDTLTAKCIIDVSLCTFPRDTLATKDFRFYIGKRKQPPSLNQYSSMDSTFLAPGST